MQNLEVYEDVFKFHGHICWASAAGARAGLAAMRELSVKRTGTSGDLHCIVEIGENHGAQCFTDGVQSVTGCTLGKDNIEKAGWGKLALTLIDKKNEKSVRVSYKPTHQKTIAGSEFMKKRGMGVPPDQVPEEDAWEMVRIIIDAPEEEVLKVEEVKPHPFQDLGEVMGLRPCAECGELVSLPYLRVVGDHHVCIPCSGYDR